VRLYYDGLSGTDGDGSFQSGSDTLIDSSVVQFSTNAAVLDITPNAVKTRLHRARQALRGLLDPHFRGDGA